MLSTVAKVFGVVMVLVGLLGFVPALTPDGHLLGIFHVNAIHNIIHLATGLAALAAGFSGYRASRTYFQVFGIVYGLVTLLGFLTGDGEILGLVANNMADNLLHVVITAAALYLGFGPIADESRPATTAPEA